MNSKIIVKAKELKDPYILDFMTLTKNYNERELENGLIQHITKFLLELGAGFAFMDDRFLCRLANGTFLSICSFIMPDCTAMWLWNSRPWTLSLNMLEN